MKDNNNFVLFVLTVHKEYNGSDDYITTSCYLISNEKVKDTRKDIEKAIEEFSNTQVDTDDVFFNYFTIDKGYTDTDNLDLSGINISSIYYGNAEL